MKKFLIMFFVFSFVFAVTQIPVEASSLSDIMGEMGNQEVPEDNFLSDASSGITKFAGILISVIIYIFFALVALTTAIDLLYIVFPPVRNSLYPKDEQTTQGYQVQMQQQGQFQVQQKRKKCWITNDLKKLLITCSLNNKKVLIVNYFKARLINIIFAVFVMILLVTTSVFTDAGMNIGKAILNFLGF